MSVRTTSVFTITQGSQIQGKPLRTSEQKSYFTAGCSKINSRLNQVPAGSNNS